MIHNSQFIKDFMNRYSYPEEAQKVFLEIGSRLDSESDFAEEFDGIVNEFMFPTADDLGEALEKVTKLAEEKNINEYSLHFVFLLNCLPILKERYAEAGLSEELFYNTMADLGYKLKECMDCEEVSGTFVAGWNHGFFDMTRFTYGRFQYEIREFSFEKDFVTSCGKVLKNGDKYINFHIPSSGVSLTDDVRLDSYKKAYNVYKHLFPDGNVIFGCGSWLLFPRHKEFLPEKSNILKFMSDFELISYEEKENFNDGWRIFGKDSDLPIEQLPRTNSLQKAYADWFAAGNKGGSGFGIIVFDGEKIVR